MKTPSLTDEPIALPSLVTAAVTATVNVIAIVGDWSGEVTAAVNIAAAAWVAALAGWQRMKVSPVNKEDDG